MDKERFLALIEKYLAGKATVEEEQLLLNFYGSFQDTLVWDEAMLGVKEEIEAKMLIRIQEHVAAGRMVKLPSRSWKLATIWKVAAAVAAITLAIWLYYTPRHPDAGQAPRSAQYANDIAPGKNTATLTLANGKTIQLSDAKTGIVIDASQIMYNDNTVISTERSDVRSLNNASGKDLSHSFEMTSVSTPRGGTYQVILPDGTHVWLNSESKISFPSQFTGKERRIIMEGEAYFEVAKAYSSSRASAAKRDLVPFIVETKRQTIEVLGTHFNVSAYADEKEMMTTLLEGKVKVKGEGNTITLDPGEQAYSGLDGIRGLKIDDPASVIAWKEGDIILDADIRTIMRQLTRWYNVEVVYEGQISNQEFGGTISRTKNIIEVLNVLQSTGRVRFKIEGRRVTVMP